MEINKYLKSVEPLAAEFNKLSEAMATAQAALEAALSWNTSIETKVKAMEDAGISEAAISAALLMDLGPTVAPKPRAPRGPNKPKTPRSETPTPVEMQLLSVMTREGMPSTEIFKQAKPDGDTAGLMGGMAAMGWIENHGGKGRGAMWALTEKGSACL